MVVCYEVKCEKKATQNVSSHNVKLCKHHYDYARGVWVRGKKNTRGVLYKRPGETKQWLLRLGNRKPSTGPK